MSIETQVAAESTAAINPVDLIPVVMVPDEYPHLFNQKQFTWLLRNRERNGLSHAIVVMGERRLFLSRSRFTEWLATRAESALSDLQSV